MKSGFTTGTCAAAAAKAAALLLETGIYQEYVSVRTPKGTTAVLRLFEAYKKNGVAGCSVRKYAGDDPDITDGAEVFAEVSYLEKREPWEPGKSWYASEKQPGIWLTGGTGIGVVTLPGLACPVGKPAINPVPRAMIFEVVSQILGEYGDRREVLVTISIPEGEALAEKTFNPRLGIQGGLSVLGTSGIVEPMSQAALLETIRLEIHMKAVAGRRAIVMAPGNYGLAFLEERFLLLEDQVVKCSNFIAAAMDMLVQERIPEVLLAGHIGKLIKIAAGVRNTHSKYGDLRMETLAGFLMQLKDREIPYGLEKNILTANTTEEAVGLLREAGLDEPVLRLVTGRIKDQLEAWTEGKVKAQVVTFSSIYGILGMTDKTEELIRKIIQNGAQ